jgi:1,4-dihydroxy-2-naphthoate octaprenyltransferase
MTDVAKQETGEPSLLAKWRYVLATTNPPKGRLDPVSKWLVLTRASVLPMTITAGLIAGLLAVHKDGFRPALFALAFVGIVLAHMANNLMNDLWDTEVGLDTENYPRALYAPHPVLTGLITRKGLLRSSLFINVLDLAILAVLFVERGWPVIALAVGGFVLSAAYTAPPLRLKKRGLGEPTVLAVWGPLMVGGCYYAAVGKLPLSIVFASIPYGLLCTTVLMGKHIDKIPWDEPEGIRTMPVIMGEQSARTFTQGLIVAFYVITAVLVVDGVLPWPALAAFGALPVLAKVWPQFNRPRPDEPPKNFPIWPLWFAPLAFVHTRRAGALLILGLIVGAVLGY